MTRTIPTTATQRHIRSRHPGSRLNKFQKRPGSRSACSPIRLHPDQLTTLQHALMRTIEPGRSSKRTTSSPSRLAVDGSVDAGGSPGTGRRNEPTVSGTVGQSLGERAGLLRGDEVEGAGSGVVGIRGLLPAIITARIFRKEMSYSRSVANFAAGMLVG